MLCIQNIFSSTIMWNVFVTHYPLSKLHEISIELGAITNVLISILSENLTLNISRFML